MRAIRRDTRFGRFISKKKPPKGEMELRECAGQMNRFLHPTFRGPIFDDVISFAFRIYVSSHTDGRFLATFCFYPTPTPLSTPQSLASWMGGWVTS